MIKLLKTCWHLDSQNEEQNKIIKWLNNNKTLQRYEISLKGLRIDN